MAEVDEVMLKVQRILTGALKLSVTLRDDHFLVGFSDASTTVMIRVLGWNQDDAGNGETAVVLSAPILIDAPASSELFEWVARNGGSRLFGHVEVSDGNADGLVHLTMSHTLLGDYIDSKELEHGLYSVLSSADEWDDELKEKFGGRRFSED